MIEPENITDERFHNKYCHEYEYTPAILPRVRRIIAIGDLHGDFELTRACLKLAKCIDDDDNWIGGDTHIVQIGDQIDSCRPTTIFAKCNKQNTTVNDQPDDIKILEYFTQLDKKARNHNGKVISLLGNHELMNVIGDMRYVSYENLKIFDPESKDPKQGEYNRIQQFKPGEKWAKYLACTRLSSVIIGDFIFVHAGFVPKFLSQADIKSKEDLIKINHQVRKWLLGVLQEDLKDSKYIQKIINSNPSSMFWDRILGTLPSNLKMSDSKCKKYLHDALNIFGVKSMVIGHTPQFHSQGTGIQMTCTDVEYPMHGLYRIDFGGSHAFHLLDPKFVSNAKFKNINNLTFEESEEIIMQQRKPQVLEIIYNDLKYSNDIPIVNILK